MEANTKITKTNAKRPPIVTVLGHVDHGKTTLLDTIRKTRVASGEAGGITQGIGASLIKTKTGSITFIDTPGHAAFSKMRSRGANVADIAILVVAADDGPMPQTKEAIGYIKAAKIPLVVAITKVDLPSANTEAVKGQLEKEGVFLEGRGGDTPNIEVSARTGKGMDELLEVINLVSEVNDITADPGGELDAVVIETGKDKRGLTASVVVREGTLGVGMDISSEDISTKVRGLFDHTGKPVKEVGPGEPALILGFSELPQVGARLVSGKKGVTSLKKALTGRDTGDFKGKSTVVIKAQSKGALEAIVANIPEQIAVIATGVGDVTESDIFLAKAAGAPIFMFSVKVPGSAKRLADTEGVKIESFDIIYELFKKLEDIVEEGVEKTLGTAEILKIFAHKEDKNIAGCKVTEGSIKKGNILTLNRGGTRLGEVRIVSLKREKKEIDEAKKGEEFGIYFEPQFDFKPKDVLISLPKTKNG